MTSKQTRDKEETKTVLKLLHLNKEERKCIYDIMIDINAYGDPHKLVKNKKIYTKIIKALEYIKLRNKNDEQNRT